VPRGAPPPNLFGDVEKQQPPHKFFAA